MCPIVAGVVVVAVAVAVVVADVALVAVVVAVVVAAARIVPLDTYLYHQHNDHQLLLL